MLANLALVFAIGIPVGLIPEQLLIEATMEGCYEKAIQAFALKRTVPTSGYCLRCKKRGKTAKWYKNTELARGFSEGGLSGDEKTLTIQSNY
ncbi:hypothetical protein GA0061070_104518 [Kosakonia oryziphila]|uniref:Uncharacterized protein n=1 Tax=Kosakonia oryziphila TaxID=1005667 RepID=A0A1C4FXA2_9ENTR|nr:hypothetical protein GA0061070_104518 [Kosakonia oryziphila]